VIAQHCSILALVVSLNGSARSGAEIVIEDPASDHGFHRKDLAKEFKVGRCHFVPCRDGVLEYGVGGVA